MEAVSSFELDEIVISLNQREMINFQMFNKEYLMSYKDFSMRIRLIDVEYTCTESYS